MLGQGGILRIPGTHNGLASQQARAAGFKACYLSGAAMTATEAAAVDPTPSRSYTKIATEPENPEPTDQSVSVDGGIES